ncbi:MAG: filamentous hemagglutinin N-terminal domain-containing protein, partial [Pseudomonadota bacterium]
MSEFRDPRFGLDARLRASTALTLVALAWPGFAYAGPRGGQIVAGDAAISRQGAVTTIQQRSQNAIGNFQSFDVGAQETVNVTQPSTRSNFLARVTGGGGASAIDGQVNATGNLWVVNPNGVLIGETASINAGGFVATSADIDNDAFMSGGRDFNISGAADAVVENRGRITFGESGLAGLVGPNAANAGAIVGQKGRVIVAGAETFAIDMAGDGILALQAGDGAVLSASTTGTIQNAGGQVIIEAATAEAVLESHIHAGGVIEATGFDVAGGQILLSGETVEVTGRLDARAVSTDAAASSAAPTGGEITVTGGGVLIASGAELDASGDGGGGTIRIGGDARGGGDLRRARLTRVDEGASLKVDANSAGDGGDIVVWGDNWTGFAGTASARGGAAGGNGGFVEISGGTLNFDEQLASVDVSAPMGTPGQLLFDPAVIYITSARLYGDVGGYDPLGPPGSDIMYGDAAQYSGITHVSPEFITTFDGDLLLEATDQINIDETVDNFDSTTVTTNLTLRSGANIDFDADLRVSGTLTLESGANFATGPTVSSFGISIGSTVTVQSGGVLSVTLGDGQSLNLYDGSNLISGGALSLPDVALYNSARVAAFGTISQQTGTAILESYTEGNNVGTLTASSSSGDVLLTNSGNGFSAIDVTAENISIAHSESASTNSGLTVLGLTAASSSIGYATISTDGPLDLTQSVTVGGPLTLTGAGISIPTNLTLSGGNLVFDTLSGVLDLETGVRLVSGSTLELPDTRFTGTLTVATAGLTQAAGTTIREGSAAATLVADTGDGDIVLTETGNDVSVIDLSGTNISLAQTSIDSASIGLTITGLDATGTADVTSGDALVLASDATATGAASFTGAGITVSGNTITGSSLSFNPGSDVLTLNDGTVLSSTASLDLPETRFVGTLTISSGGLTQTGGTALIESSTGSTLVADTGTGDIVLATATNAISNIDLSGDDITLSQTTAAVGVNALGVAGLDATGDATLSTDGVLR